MDWWGSDPEGELSDEATFLVRLLWWVRGAFWLSVVAMLPLLISAFRDQDPTRPVLILVPLYLFVIIPLTEVAMRAAARGDASRASMLSSLLMWGPALMLAIIVPQLTTVSLVAALIPAVFAIPYASRRAHQQIILISAAVSIASGAIGSMRREFVPSGVEAERTGMEFLLPEAIVAAFLMVAVWHSAERLRKAFELQLSANRKLAESERNLESTVARRTHELADARDSALHASRAKSVFLANMSHELRTPMNAIIGYSEMLMEDAEDEGNDSAVGDLKKINRAGQHLLALINDVLDLSKIEAGKMDLHLETFEIPSLIDDVVATVGPLVEKNENRLKIDLAADLPEMSADKTKVRQALFNLLSNAAKFTHEGEIDVTVRTQLDAGSSWVIMSISDSGIGVAPDKLSHIFEEFSQADDTTTRDYGGTGLGLAISRRFCRMMGGDIGVESVEGQGSTFTIRLPLSVALSEQPDNVGDLAPAITPEPGEERTVLVIDDDPNALDLLSRTLQSAGLRVLTASNGREGLQLARSLQPMAITLDVMMPGMDGWEVLSHLQEDPSTRDIPVIMLTMTDDRQLGFALGATEFLTKPVDRSQLVELLERYTVAGEPRLALVVDDEPESRRVLRSALEKEGWEVAEAENGRAALDQVDRQTPALILLDLMMPVMDGFEFAMEMRRRDGARAIPIVVVTAKDITKEDRRRLNGSVVGLIEKRGLDRDALLAQVRELLAGTATRIDDSSS